MTWCISAGNSKAYSSMGKCIGFFQRPDLALLAKLAESWQEIPVLRQMCVIVDIFDTETRGSTCRAVRVARYI